MNSRTEQLLLQFKVLADPVRLRLVSLCRLGESSVSELTQAVGHSQPRVSQHLKKLVDAGLLERFRDGKRVYYRVPAAEGHAARRLLDLLPDAEPVMLEDAGRLAAVRADRQHTESVGEASAASVSRAVHRLLLELTVTAPVGDLLVIGCGKVRLLKLLASRANRAVGVDI